MNFKTKTVTERIMLVVIDLYLDGKGVPDPSLAEIAVADAKANGSVNALSDVQRVEASVRADLADLLNATGHQKYFVVPLNWRYYAEYRGATIPDVGAAKRCIAGRGRGMGTEGFMFTADPDHPLQKAYLDTLALSANGKVEALVNRIDSGIKAGMITDGAQATALLPALRHTRSRSAKAVKELAAQ